jgi:hypothetical protein
MTKKSKSKSKSTEDWTYYVAYNFTGCCIHADITYNESNGDIDQIIGYFEYNNQCKAAMVKQFPSVPLHEHVYEIVLAQLSHGARYIL